MTRSTRKRGAEESTKEAKRPKREQKAAKPTREQSRALKGATKTGQEPVRQTRASSKSSKPLAPLDEEPERLLRKGRAKKQQRSSQAQPKRQEPASSSGSEDVAAAAAAQAVGARTSAMDRRQGSAGQPGHEVGGLSRACFASSEMVGARVHVARGAVGQLLELGRWRVTRSCCSPAPCFAGC